MPEFLCEAIKRKFRFGERDDAAKFFVRFTLNQLQSFVGAPFDFIERVHMMPVELDVSEHPAERIAFGQLIHDIPQGSRRTAVHFILQRIPTRRIPDRFERNAKALIDFVLRRVVVAVKERHGMIAEMIVSIDGLVDLGEDFVQLRSVSQRIEGFSDVLFDKGFCQVVEVNLEFVEVRKVVNLLE
jgi:hypothetical protein